MIKMNITLGVVAMLMSSAAYAQSGVGEYVSFELSGSALVDRAGWSESAALSLATSAVPDYQGSHYWHDDNWNTSFGNRASGTVTVSSDSGIEGSDVNSFSLAGPGAASDVGGFFTNIFSTDPEAVLLLPVSVAASPAPEIDFVHEGTVTMSGKTRGGASLAGYGESLGFVNATSSRTAGAEYGYAELDSDGNTVKVPVAGGVATTTTSLFGAMQDPDDEVGLISRVYYGAELSSSRGSKARLNETEVGQKVTARAGGDHTDSFSLTREAGDLTLSGRLKGNGLSLFQEADRAAIAGGGVSTELSLSVFQPYDVEP